MRRGRRRARLGLFFGQIADYRQFDSLIVVRREHQVQPQDAETQTDQREQEKTNSVRENSEKAHQYPKGDVSHVEENRLKSVKAHKLVLVVRRNDQEDDSCDKADEIAQSAGNILAHARGSSG